MWMLIARKFDELINVPIFPFVTGFDPFVKNLKKNGWLYHFPETFPKNIYFCVEI